MERFHQTLQADCFQAHGPFPDVAAAQAAVDAFRVEYNHDRPHQALDDAVPGSRFVPVAAPVRAELGLDIPAELLNILPAAVSELEPADQPEQGGMGEVAGDRQGFLTGEEHWLAGRPSNSSEPSARAETSRLGRSSSGSGRPTPGAGSGSGWTPRQCTCPWTGCT